MILSVTGKIYADKVWYHYITQYFVCCIYIYKAQTMPPQRHTNRSYTKMCKKHNAYNIGIAVAAAYVIWQL